MRERELRAMSCLNTTAPDWIAFPVIAMFLWAECLDCVGLRTFIMWWRS